MAQDTQIHSKKAEPKWTLLSGAVVAGGWWQIGGRWQAEHVNKVQWWYTVQFMTTVILRNRTKYRYFN